MKNAVRQRARELGFDDCRFTTASPPNSVPHLQQWLADGRHGEMAWLERNAHKRIDPQLVLSGARSILSLAVSYSADAPHRVSLPPAAPLSGFVARYARYKDYHKVLAPPLKTLAAFVNQLGGHGARSLWYVDTGPLLERDLAERAGLGFIGKHTNLISRRLGNWILLAEIITTVEFAPDPPEHNHCGTCARCIAACPTAAITAPFQLDARRCISYLTIELKGSIPVELRPAIGNRIFGCDDCLAVCPWNRLARDGAIMKTRARPELAAPDLVALLALDDTSFRRHFEGTPMLRAGRRSLLRNVCVALGNSHDQRALPALQKPAHDPEPLIAEHARWAIDQIHLHSRPANDPQPKSDR